MTNADMTKRHRGINRRGAARRSIESRADTSTNRANGNERLPLRGLIPFFAFLALWQVFGSAESVYFPKPSTWFPELLQIWKTGELVAALFATAITFVVSLCLATVVGVILGILVGSVRLLDRALGPTLEFLRATPSSAQVPIFVLLLGYTESMKLTVVVLTALFPILLSTRAGIRTLNSTLMDVGRTLRLGRVARIRKIMLPSLSMSILTGVRIATPIVLIVTLIVEILTQVPGLGGSVSTAKSFFQTPLVFGLILVITIVALLVNLGVSSIDSILRGKHRG